MKKRIKGLEYNTETARQIANISEYSKRDYCHFEETLYRKRTGEFFIYGSGNAESKYGKAFEDSFTSGEGIKPLSFDEAKKWYKTILDDPSTSYYGFTEKQYKELFSTAGSSEKTVLSLSISKKAKKALLDMATKEGKSQSEVVENLILGQINS
ncbi:hypothetical protein [Ligilactobacillus saerimneri]|uniref:hypothetical protein n=1 Tax=Ligilactobacillus saerimneri TaxID=228229 RepID=UPI0004182F39|nr:hypothetical protein [Ligilactobacillus saerimneri]KRL70743.1 hypothetical protein FC54_GL001548 [Ligilactobacillus saerimneri DSM 16049]